MTKKRSPEILADGNRNVFGEKVKLVTFSTRSPKYLSEIHVGGNLKQRGNASLPQGDGRPCENIKRTEV